MVPVTMRLYLVVAWVGTEMRKQMVLAETEVKAREVFVERQLVNNEAGRTTVEMVLPL